MSEQIEIVLCSDNHMSREPLDYLKNTYSPHDYFLHCGDSEMAPYEMEGFSSVQGNNDHFQFFPNERILKIGEHNILLVHGHKDMFFGRYEMLADKAITMGCDIVMCGHTHVYYDKVIKGVHILNPGSIWRNRDGSAPSYMLIHLDGKRVYVKHMTYEPLSKKK